MIENLARAVLEVRDKTISHMEPNFFNRLKPQIVTSLQEADKPIESNKFKAVDEALDRASNEEKEIYEDANIEKSEINGREVLKRTDIDYDEEVGPFGETNLERMEQGKPPIKDGKPIELHHIGQKMDSPLAELTQEEHRGKGNDAILHDKQKESEIDREKFNKERADHWKARAGEIKAERGV